MPRRLIPALLAALVLVLAVVLAELGTGDGPSSAARTRAAPDPEPQEQAQAEPDPHGSLDPADPHAGMEMDLPPNHPAIDPGAMGAPSRPSGGDAPSITWKMPAEWQEAPNPNPMRLATYRAPGGAEMSVARAGGSTDANIRRWIGQFEDAGASAPESKTVHGLRVTTVLVVGTYGGGMGMGTEPQPDWALLGAVVEAPGAPYFFKLVGPARAVKAARPAFDRLVASIALP